MKVGDLVTYKEAEFGLVGIIVEVMDAVGDGDIFYELAKSYHFANRAEDYPEKVELCKVYWLQADRAYMEFMHDLEIISESR